MATVVDHDYTVASDTALTAYTEDSIGYVELVNTASTAVMRVNASADDVQVDTNEDNVGIMCRVDTQTTGADYTVQADATVNSAHSQRPCIIFGRVADANNWYAAALYRPSDNPDVVLYKNVSGTVTQLGTHDEWSSGAHAGQTFSLDMSGTTIRVLVGGVEKISVTDSAISAKGYAGIGFGNLLVSTDDIRLAEHLDNLLVSEVAAGANPKGPLGMPLHGPFGGPV